MAKRPKRPKSAYATSLTIPPHGWRRCSCGYIMIGPAYTAVDGEGYLWNCALRALRVKEADDED